jgi:dTDP-4-amino-4,6-dideoxygalactose transaminase
MYDVLTLGLNYRMSELQGAIGRKQIGRIEENLAVRRANFVALKGKLALLPNVRVLDATSPEAENSHYCLSAVLDGDHATLRNEVVARLNKAGVGTSVYYPQPVPRMTYYREKYGYNPARFPHATEISDQSIALPVGHHITQEDIGYITERFTDALEEVSA